jgi:D-serine deaminase-like pyridoxal phosphate-dependent protein
MKLTKPTLLVDKRKCLNNIRYMTEKAGQNGLTFRPHFKTHQSREIGRWFRDFGVDKITVSSVDMANYFAADGWNDITIAFPLNINETARLDHLARQSTISLTVLNPESIEALRKDVKAQAGIFIKVDTGNKRTGIPYENAEEIKRLKEMVEAAPNLYFRGLLVHAGHTYRAGSNEEILRINRETNQRLLTIKDLIRDGKTEMILSTGDTPSCSLSNDFENIQEIRPGNFVFYDMQQYKLGSCSLKDIAVCVACPVVAKHEERNEIIIYGGAVHFSKDTFIEDSKPAYGYGVSLSNDGWSIPEEKMILGKVSQEHGTLYANPETIKKYKPGDFIGIFPAHSCLTANLMGSYTDVKGGIYDHMQGSCLSLL